MAHGLTLYFFLSSMMTGRFASVPSMENRPSTMSRIFFHGRCVFGWPWLMTSRNSSSSAFMSLCLNMRTFAPLSRTPYRIEAWLSSSEMTRQPLLTRPGMMFEFVAKPMELMSASSTPRNRATSASACWCRSRVPPSRREPPAEMPYRPMLVSTASAHGPLPCAKPR